MSKTIKDFLKYSVIFFIMAYMLYDAFNQIDDKLLEDLNMTRLEFIFSYWTSSNKFFVALSILFAILSHIIRALRWKIVLEPIGYRKVSSFNATIAVLNGYFINLFIPRGGEFSRPFSLQKTDNVPTDVGVGTVVTERIIDLIFLVICISTVFAFQTEVIYNFVMEGIAYLKESQTDSAEEFPWKKIIFFGFIALGILGVIGIYVFKREFFVALKTKGETFLKGMWTGIISILKLEKRILFIFYSLLIWVLYYAMLYTMFLAFSETQQINAIDALSIFVVGGIAMALPLPGGTGSYHIMVSFALTQLCFLSYSSALAIVTIFHGLHTVNLIILGGISVFFIARNTKYGNKT